MPEWLPLQEKKKGQAPSLPTKLDPEMEKYLAEYKFNDALSHIWKEIAEADKKVNETKPWELSGEDAKEVLIDLVSRIQHIAYNLQPFLPSTAEEILNQFSGQVKSQASLFPRIS